MRKLAKNVTVFAALAAASLVATPLVMGASNAFATAEAGSAAPAPVAAPVERAPVAAPVAKGETCTRKVRVVYGGYGTPDAACIAR
ncbi:hypothetical protein [uncultured Methylobacterium sp.]|uniref:hypothetical protein n=1 Tax=uncultured Methylobacterium sp. TaxID=157278 RepID=UPI0035CA25D2